MKIVILLLSSYLLIPCKAQTIYTLATDNPQKTSIDSTVHKCVSAIFNDNNIVGLSIGIYKDDLAFCYNYGTIEKDKRILPTSTTIYEIGSITKTFTGILLAQAVLDNKIKFDDDISIYLKEEYKNLEYNGIPIRVINLANHTAGLPEDIYPEIINKLKNPSMFDIINIYDGDRGLMFLKDLHNVTLETQPGEKRQYSNVGMIILGNILENVYGVSYSQLIEKYITVPLEMIKTGIVSFESDTTNYTKGYDKAGNIMPHITFQIAGAAGGLKSSIPDMINYLKANITETNKAIKLSHEKTIGTDENGIGLGWQIRKGFADNKQLWHDGGEPGFSSYCLVIPSKKIGIICLMNQRGHQAQLYNLSEKIIDSLQKD
jgi:D-alanyl-D-alanine-carboxypeptidase/D-alanyl-D-alanine-endopeptidase